MNLTNTIISMVGDLLVLLSAVILVWTLIAVNGARTDAQAAERAAVKARKDATDREITAQQQAEKNAKAADQWARDAAAREARAAERTVDWQRELSLERRRDCVVRIGELVDGIFWTLSQPGSEGPANNVSIQQWMPERNRIGRLLVGLKTDLPECTRLLSAAAASSALEHARLARGEIDLELEYIDKELYLTRNPQYYPEATGSLLAGQRVWPSPRKP
jgi:hypothetical protein